MNNYSIKSGYLENESPEVYRDTIENAQTYQVDIYRHAGRMAYSSKISSVLDLGCGFATKLVQYVAPFCNDITGVDLAPAIRRCRVVYYSIGQWIAGDLEDPDFALPRSYDLIIAADVIEHLREPDRLLAVIRGASHNTTQVILSTPERDLRRGKTHMGPPDNLCHVREWNGAEFAAYLWSRDFAIQGSRIVDLRVGMPSCQMVIGRFGRVSTT